MPHKIEKLWAFVYDDGDGEEGIGGKLMEIPGVGKSFMQFVVSQEKLVKEVLPHAEIVSRASGKPFRILEFSVRKDVTEEYTNG